jgi:hypothetical protein
MITKAERATRKAERLQRDAIFMEKYNWEKQAYIDLVDRKILLHELVKDPHWKDLNDIDKDKFRTLAQALTNRNKSLIDLFRQEEIEMKQFTFTRGYAHNLLQAWVESTGDQTLIDLFDEYSSSHIVQDQIYWALTGKMVLPSSWLKYIQKSRESLSSLLEKATIEHPEFAEQPRKNKKGGAVMEQSKE